MAGKDSRDLSGTSLSVKDFNLGKTLGIGSFGRVRFVTYNKTGQHYALKTLKKASIVKMFQVDHVISEKSILQAVKHPFIVNLWGSFHDERYVHLLLEYIVGGEFFTHLRKAVMFDDHTSCFYAAQIVSIFGYLHSKDIVYRDLKPENILMTADGYVKLTDFGFAKVVEHRTYTLCGTPEYLAPEVILNKGHGKPVDWWTLGILMYEMMVGYPPFIADDPLGVYQKILSGKTKFPKIIVIVARGLIRKFLTADLGKRTGNLKNGVDDIMNHKWFSRIDFQLLERKQFPAPFQPTVRSETDTGNYDDYPDSDQEAPPLPAAQDPFREW